MSIEQYLRRRWRGRKRFKKLTLTQYNEDAEEEMNERPAQEQCKPKAKRGKKL